jgi:hypothetical protein
LLNCFKGLTLTLTVEETDDNKKVGEAFCITPGLIHSSK